MSDKDLLELAMEFAKLGPNSSPIEPAGEAADTAEPPLQNTVQPSPMTLVARSREKKTHDELAAMILADLRGVEGCPKRGVKVVVYGLDPWNVWLSFGAEAGPVRNKAELQAFCDIITERLKRIYDATF
jgi:hypothetical protein